MGEYIFVDRLGDRNLHSLFLPLPRFCQDSTNSGLSGLESAPSGGLKNSAIAHSIAYSRCIL